MTDFAASDSAETLIRDANVKTFATDVIAASREVPVIVDFWADWCGPCKQLMPALESAVTAAKGAVRLVKVNADENQAICAQLRIQSLPTVIAFWQGQPVDGFQGAVPPSQIQAFIERLKELSGGAGVEDPVAEAYAAANEMFDAGNVAEAAQVYQQILGHEPGHEGAIVGLADAALKLGKPEGVDQILGALDESKITDKKLLERIRRIRTTLELAAEAEKAGDPAALRAHIDANPLDYEARFQLSLALQARGDMAGAADALLAIIMRDRTWNDDAARKQLVKLFDAAGPNDPFTLKYRRRLSSVLFS